MLETLIWATAAICGLATIVAYLKYKDVFHPLIYIPPMFVFIYVYMPLHFLKTRELFSFVPEPDVTFVQLIILLTVGAFIGGCFIGSDAKVRKPAPSASLVVDAKVLHLGAYVLGFVGLVSWVITIRNAGGITGAFGVSDGAGWSDYGYIREAIYLLIAGLLLLISPEGFRFPDIKWTAAVVVFTIPWLMQGLLGARRGPTFVIVVTLVMSWFLARKTRPSPVFVATGGFALGVLMLFLVTNRGQIYIGSEFNHVKTDVTEMVTAATEANEYIFGAGCMIVADAAGHHYYGARYLAEIFIRPIPKQLWPNKYDDTGLASLMVNGGVVVGDLPGILGWQKVPGAAAAFVADLWVEFYWGAIPIAGLIGWVYGYVWRRAIQDGRFWTSEYTILAMVSIYLATQSGEAVIFRLVILTVTVQFVWRKALSKRPILRPVAVPRPSDQIQSHA